MRKHLIRILAAMVLATLTVWAQEGRGGGKGRRGGGGGAGFQPDANGDGVVDEMEAEQAAQRMFERAEAMLNRIKEKYDTDGDGTLNEAEVKKLQNALEEQGNKMPPILSRIDKDNNWNISEEEKTAAIKQTAQRFMRGKDGGKDGGGKGRRGRIDPDTNGDCLIDENEALEAAKRRIDQTKQWMPKLKERFSAQGEGRFPPMLAMIDTDQNWEISAEEEAAAIKRICEEYQARNELVLKYFDENEDGKLDEAEQAAAKKAMAFAEEGVRNANRRRMGNRGQNRQGRRGRGQGAGRR